MSSWFNWRSLQVSQSLVLRLIPFEPICQEIYLYFHLSNFSGKDAQVRGHQIPAVTTSLVPRASCVFSILILVVAYAYARPASQEMLTVLASILMNAKLPISCPVGLMQFVRIYLAVTSALAQLVLTAILTVDVKV